MYNRYNANISSSVSTTQIWDAITPWTETEKTYNNFPAWSKPEAVSWQIPGQTQDNTGAENIVDITKIVQRWADQFNSDINGIIIMDKTTTNGTMKSFYSKEASDPALRPKLVIKYDTRDNYRIISPSDDARVRSANTTGNFGSQGFTSAGVHPEIADAQSWFKFPLTSIPAGKTITKATLELVEYASGYSVATSSAVTVHRSLANWNEGTITWSNKPSYNSTASASLTIGAQTDFGIRQWDVTHLMRDFYTGVHANHGFVLVSAHSKYFNTKEFADVFRRPRLRVEFSDTDSEAPNTSFSPAWSENTLSVTLGFTDNIAYKDHRYAWTTSTAKPTSWSSWSTNSSPTYTRTTSGNWYLHVEARDTANNVAYNFAGPYTTEPPAITETAWFDAVQLEVGDRVSSFNLLSNTGFEKLSGTLPAGYKATNQTGTVTITSDTASKFSGSRSVKLVSSGSNAGYLELNNQEVTLKPSTRYTLSFWVFCTSVTNNTKLVALHTADSAGTLSTTDYINYRAGGTFDQWRNVTITFTTPSSARTLGALRFGFNTAGSGTVWFDDITLKEEGTTIRALYTTNGNYLRQIQDAEGKAVVTYNYTEDDLLRGVYSSVTDAKGNVQSFTYDVFNRVTGVTDNTTGTSQSYTYNNQDNLSTITREGFTYTFDYDNFGRMTQVRTPAHTLVTNTYDELHGTLIKTTFGNDQAIDYTYNTLDQLKDVVWNDALRYSYEYDARGNIVLVTDHVNNTATWYTYDLADRLLNFREVSTLDNSQIGYVTYDYDKNNKATKILETIGTTTYTTSFTYNKDNTVASITTNYGEKLEFYYNEKGMPDRTVRKVNNQPHSYTNYRYNQRGLLTMLEHSKGRYNYSHDQNGNITGIVGPGSSHNYTYDALNQLLSERITAGGQTREIVYTYDKLGNMTTRTEGTNQVEYSYTYDRLTQIRTYQNGVLQNTQNLTYDNAGNVTNDGEYTYTWQMGRQLAGMSKPGLTTSYQYNENGLRTRKILNDDRTHEYIYMGSNVTREIIRDGANILWTIYYSYAGGNSPTSMNVNGVNYYFLKNAQGDITHILNASGNEVGAYEYDAWGNILSVTGGEIAELNPYRYRGYRYDAETGLYYLQSRYYNPVWGRFINADVLVGKGQMANMFAYCFNNPVNHTDTTGMVPDWMLKIGKFFSPKTNTVSGKSQKGIFRQSGTLTGGYSEFNGRLQVNAKDSKSNGMLGGYGKVSVGNASGKTGIGNEKMSLSHKGVVDALTATTQAGIQYENGLGLAARAKASVISGRVTREIELFNWQIEFGVSGDALSVGAELMIGMFPDEGFTVKASAGAGLFGAGYVFRVKPPQ